jgi:malonyl-CoA/methylmalonyl-CoA synthetase
MLRRTFCDPPGRLQAKEISVLMAVPTMYAHMLSAFNQMAPERQEAARQGAAALRLAVSGSSACPMPVLQRWQQLAGERDTV